MQEMPPKRIFVTGSGGILGRHLCSALSALAPQAEVLRNTADLTDPERVRAEIETAGPVDLVYHLAALVPVAAVKENPARAFAVNVGGTINLLEAMHSSDAGLVLCSSGHVYQGSDQPIAEDAPKIPISLYGQSKLMAEDAATAICSATQRRICIGRVFSIHDPAQTGSYLRPTLSRRLREHNYDTPFDLYGADSLRDFLTAQDAAHLLARLGLSGASGAVNIASGKGTRVRDFAQSLASSPLNINPLGATDALVADTSRLRKILGDKNV